MFSFFKKKKEVKKNQDWEFNLLKAIISKLPKKYDFLKPQISLDFFIDSVDNEFLKDGWKRVVSNQNLYSNYRNENINYLISDIEIFDLLNKKFINVDLDLYEGIIIGYKIFSNSNEYDLNQINISNIKEKQFQNEDVIFLKQILGKVPTTVENFIDIENTFKIELTEGTFYVIKDLTNGNYLSIDKNGAVYGMIHDPYEIEKLFDNKTEFYNAILSNNFDSEDYFNTKMS